MKSKAEIPKTISAAYLKRHGACERAIVQFVELFGPKPVPITRDNWLKAKRWRGGLLDPHWLCNLLGVCGGYSSNCPDTSAKVFRKIFGGT